MVEENEVEELKLAVSNLIHVLAVKGIHAARTDEDCEVCATIIRYQDKYPWLIYDKYWAENKIEK